MFNRSKIEVVANFETRVGDYEIHKWPDGTYRVVCDGVDKQGVCSPDDIIAWFANALHNAEYFLMRIA